MGKIRKKSSKRVTLRKQYTAKKEISKHNKKMRKAARRLTKAGVAPRPKRNKSSIPNSFPGKEDLINEMESQMKL